MAKTVTLYTTETCSYCKAEKAFLVQNSIDFEEVRVDVDDKAAQAMINLSGQMGVPVTVVGDEHVVGFDQPRLAAALGLNV